MKLNKVVLTVTNPALVSLIKDFNQVLPVDANFFIPFDRSNISKKIQPLPFNFFKKCWIQPLFLTFPHLAIHEAVYNEITVAPSSKSFIDQQIQQYQQPLVLSDKNLDDVEEITRYTIEGRVAKYTNYEPEKNNKDDRGEVKSLAHIATKGYLYFCSHDSNALKLIEKAVEWETNLEEVNAIKTYEILYYLYKSNPALKKEIRAIYKYLYYTTDSDRKVNPSWDDFKTGMDSLYDELITSCPDFPIITIPTT
ncbi:hypothetical protein [Neobacillus sp. OS1-33]|uniref:hypothetical protein n=1 Tax=Neobacillus sp. OS1-33 TaxID=3070683 RepID=UPI0027DF2C39|nr:hypothetical protein [Neobacillus sp. OS1-33]WML26259.1 hypothetical protein RCG22_01020 [Neobacillus sp. OS1-33]